jgi:hypothetical protein
MFVVVPRKSGMSCGGGDKYVVLVEEELSSAIE